MSKKFNSIFMVLVFVALTIFVAVEVAEAFCVYNKTDTQIYVSQESGHKAGRGIEFFMDPGGKEECCHWTNADCNKEGKRDSIVRFIVYKGSGASDKVICNNFPIKAGGWLEVIQKGDKYICTAHSDILKQE